MTAKRLPPYEPDQAKRDGSHATVEATVEGCRKQLHDLLHQCLFWGRLGVLPGGDPATWEAAKSGAYLAVQFAVRAGLMCRNEADDWLDVLADRLCLAECEAVWVLGWGPWDGPTTRLPRPAPGRSPPT